MLYTVTNTKEMTDQIPYIAYFPYPTVNYKEQAAMYFVACQSLENKR